MSNARHIITATSWNGTEFVYNIHKDTWQMMDSVTIGQEHYATTAYLVDAEVCKDLENCSFVGAIRLEEYANVED